MPSGHHNNPLRPEKFLFKRFRTGVQLPPSPPAQNPRREAGIPVFQTEMKQNSSTTYRNVPVFVDECLRSERSVQPLVRRFIDQRFRTPILVYPREGRSNAMRFASPREERLDAARVRIPLDDCVGVLLFVGGPEGAQVTQEDYVYALRLWYEPVFVEPGQDGTPWIDD